MLPDSTVVARLLNRQVGESAALFLGSFEPRNEVPYINIEWALLLIEGARMGHLKATIYLNTADSEDAFKEILLGRFEGTNIESTLQSFYSAVAIQWPAQGATGEVESEFEFQPGY